MRIPLSSGFTSRTHSIKSIGETIMTTALQITRRWIVALVVAALIAVTAAYGPVALEMAGIEAATAAYACNPPGAGC